MINIWLNITDFFSTRLALAALEIDYAFSPNIAKPSILQVFGVSENPAVLYLKSYFSQFTFTRFLSVTNVLITILLVIFASSIIALLIKMLSYTHKDVKIVEKIKLIPLALGENTFAYFQNYCQRDEAGMYYCSYSKHKTYQRVGRLTLYASWVTFLLKVGLTVLIIGFQGGYIQAFSGREGDNYNIFVDTFAGGGHITSTNYMMDSSFGEGYATNTSTSSSYTESAGFTSIGDETSIGFSVGINAISLGLLSITATASSSHTFNVFYNGDRGYDVYLQSSPPTEPISGHILQPIGNVPVSSQTGVEQYGVNLKANTLPSIGANASGGSGQPTANYNIQNQYAYQQGDIIAESSLRSATTTFTTSVIINIDSMTPAGAYTGLLTYVVVPRY